MAQITRRTQNPAAFAALALAFAGACAVVALAAAVVFIRPSVRAAPRLTEATVGGLHYSVNAAWVLDPRRRVDAKVARGLPAAARTLGPDQLLYAVFVGVTNETDQPHAMADRIVLRDVRNRPYHPLRLGDSNAYAYRPVVIAAKTHVPSPWSPAGRDIAAGGEMLVFRIDRQAYGGGPLELELRDPQRPDTVHTLLAA